MRNIIIVVLLVLNIMVTSCFSAKQLIRKSDKEIAPFKSSVLNGIYDNIITDSITYSLWQDLYANEHFRGIEPAVDASAVELELIDNKTLMAYLLIDGKRTASLKIKGRLKQEYFVANRKFTILPLVFANYYKDHKTVLGNLPNGDLHIVQGKQRQLFMLDGYTDVDDEIINADYRRLDSTEVASLMRVKE